MDEFTIWCTPEQTRKALELGAPIVTTSKEPSMFFCAAHPKTIRMNGIKNAEKDFTCAIPTTEQMLGWLDDKINDIQTIKNVDGTYAYVFYPTVEDDYQSGGQFVSRSEAILAVIDTALEYLVDKNLVK